MPLRPLPLLLAAALALSVACEEKNPTPPESGGAQGGEAPEGGGPGGAAGGGEAPAGATPGGIEAPSVEPVDMRLEAPAEVSVRSEVPLSVKVIMSDGSERAPDSVTWEALTSNVTVSAAGVAAVGSRAELRARATATLAGLSKTLEWAPTVQCAYPGPTGASFNLRMELNTVLPPLRWVSAFSARTGEEAPLRLEDVYCNAEFDWVKTINLLTTAGWCPACPDYLRAVAALNPTLKDEGGLLIYIDVQDRDYAPADSDFANEHLSALLGPTEGYFVGDVDAQPVPRFFGQSPAVEAFPDSYVVRRSDMMILTTQNLNRERGMVPFVEIARDPTRDWSTFEPPPFMSICGPTDDEAGEPNDEPGQATPLSAGELRAGICTAGPDFFSVTTEGAWTVRISFDPAQADLDLYQVSEASPDMPLQTSNGTGATEELSGTGPALLVVVSYTGTSVLYTVNTTLMSAP